MAADEWFDEARWDISHGVAAFVEALREARLKRLEVADLHKVARARGHPPPRDGQAACYSGGSSDDWLVG